MNAQSYSHGTTGSPLLGMTVGENLRQAVARSPEREALVVRSQDRRFTYREFWELSGRVARGFMAAGIEKGDRVGIWAPNRFEWVVVQFATARIGAILVNINPAYKSAELKYALNQCGVRMLVMSEGFRTTDYREVLGSVRGELAELKRTLVLEDDWEALVEAADQVDEGALEQRESALQFDDPINVQYTSGTTGFPKGATLSHHNILNNGYFVGEICGYTEADRVCIPVPFYHCFGMVMGNLGCTTHGACMVIPGESFEPGEVLEAIEAERCTSLYGVPTMFIAELDHPDFDGFDLSSLRTGIMAGSLCPAEVMRQVTTRMNMPEVTICYGMTETSPVSTQTRTGDSFEKRTETVGSVHPHVEVKIVDPESGSVVPRGEPGELCTRGYSVMLGYWNNEAGTQAAIDRGRWMHTGDLATMDAEGYVRIVGRIKDMIIRGGENIYPREIEEFLYTHEGVADVQVIGVPDPKYGEEVMAWIKPRAGVELAEAELRRFCTGQIATFKIPRYWSFVDEFPMTVTGKVQKFKMREMAIVELGLTLE